MFQGLVKTYESFDLHNRVSDTAVVCIPLEIVGVGKEGQTLVGPWDNLNRQHPLLKIPRGLLAVSCRRTLGGERHRYAVA